MTDWKRKLAAYLHDPPSKCLDILNHGERSDAAFRQAGFKDTEVGKYFAHADHTAAAADRLPFPNSKASGLQCAFDGIRNGFLHPLSGEQFRFHAEFKSVEQGFEGENSVQPALSEESLCQFTGEDEPWRARFFAHWRLWPKHAAEKDYRLRFLPADTRIPDHSIWTHMQVVSALDGCIGNDKEWRPAFLKFQLGPVQEFIAAARSVRDLWSGSFLLSWLMASGLKALSEKVGPDAVIFPNLNDQPLFDLHWRRELWSKVSIGSGKSVWESLGWSPKHLLTPNLPNVFLALVPADQASGLAQTVAVAIENEWKRIADSVWLECERIHLTHDESNGITNSDRKKRFEQQVNRFLSLAWNITQWPNTMQETLELAKCFTDEMVPFDAEKRIRSIIDMAENKMPMEHRDGRFYEGNTKGPKQKLNNTGLGWSLILAINGWGLDAVRQTRAFRACGSGEWKIGLFSNKDSLNGREEAVAGGRTWCLRAKNAGGYWPSLFKKEDWLSASTLIKRVWHQAYLSKDPWNLRTDSQNFPMPNTRGVASHQPDKDCESDETSENAGDSEKYFAVLAFDGDKIGKWVSGEKTPVIATQLADYTDGSGRSGYGSKPYFQRPEFGGFLTSKRPLSPSYHLQFSEALSHFALRCARPVVESYHGRLIYAGGDDVLALLPSDSALECAQALRKAFQGESVVGLNEKPILESPTKGYLTSPDYKDDNGRKIPFLVPGPRADCSVGIAIAHFKAPLQDVIRAAQSAEKRAKRSIEKGGMNRKAVAVTLMKHSGEIIEWGSKWEGGLVLYQQISKDLGSGVLSSKFPHRLCELLTPYLSASTGLTANRKSFKSVHAFQADEIIRNEMDHCLLRHRGPNFPKTPEEILGHAQVMVKALQAYFDALTDAGIQEKETRLRSVIGLCQTVAFAHRTAVAESKRERNHK